MSTAQREARVNNARGDRLDAALSLSQAGCAVQRPRRGLPPAGNPVEGRTESACPLIKSRPDSGRFRRLKDGAAHSDEHGCICQLHSEAPAMNCPDPDPDPDPALAAQRPDGRPEPVRAVTP